MLRAAAMVGALAFLSAAPPVRAGPAVNISVVGLRPYAITGLDEKDTADYLGDLFFYFGDRVAWRKSCQVDPSGFFCRCEVTCDDNVYTLYTVEALTGIDHVYAMCNPANNNVSDPQYKCANGDAFSVGYADVAKRYPDIAATCLQTKVPPFPKQCEWKYTASKKVGGAWYSHPAVGNCANNPGNCSWRIVETIKIINEDCVTNHVTTLFEQRNRACFAECPTYDPAGDCYLDCYFGTIGDELVTREELEVLFRTAFEKDDEAVGGCPGRVIPPAAK